MGPITAATGFFPAFYQDNTGLALDLCLPAAGPERDNGDCLIFPADLPNGAGAIVFPGNFPEEAFWWNAGAIIPAANGNAILVLAVEAAFGIGPVLAGDQITFGRIRIRFIAPSAGHYTVTHPYGKEEFDAEAGELIFFSEDAGINCGPGNFSCVLNGRIGPFLRASTSAGGPALAPVPLDGRTYLVDPAADTFVTGSPFNTNVFKIEGPDIGGQGST